MHLLDILKILAVLVGAAILGNWFLKEVKEGKIAGKPWYAPYRSIPGIMVVMVILLPILIWLFR